MTNLNTKVRRCATFFQCSLVAVALMNANPTRALAQDGHAHMSAQPQPMSLYKQGNAETLIKIVRQATDRFKDVKVAEAEGYALQFGCVSGDDLGAMGIHYVNGDLVNKGELD